MNVPLIRLAIASLALSLGACSKASSKQPPMLTPHDASVGLDAVSATAVSVDADSGPQATRVTVDRVRELWHTASTCGTRPCSELPELRALIKSDPDLVAMGAVDVMDDQYVLTGQGVGFEAIMYLDRWFRKGPTDVARAAAGAALERVTENQATVPEMRNAALVFLAENGFPAARRILISDIDTPRTNPWDHYGSGRLLGTLIEDFEVIRRYFADARPSHWMAAMGMLHTFDQDGKEARWAEQRSLLVTLGKRPDLPAAVVEQLAYWFDLYLDEDPNDPLVRPLVERWAKHPDDAASQAMSKLLVWYPKKPRPTP